jgi:hypothetical protein
MANYQVKNRLGIVDKRMGQGNSATQHSGTTETNTKDVTSMRARLAAINGAYYTSAMLDKMTTNDMLYAIRLNDEAGSV